MGSGLAKAADTPGVSTGASTGATEKEVDAVSIGSSSSSLSLAQSGGRNLGYDYVELSIHGINDAGL